MVAIAFYLENRNISEIDFSQPLLGNPGVGATEFMTIVIASQLALLGKDVVLYANSNGNFPSNLSVTISDSLKSAFEQSVLDNRILVIRTYISGLPEIISEIASHPRLRIVFWAHLTPSQSNLRLMSKTSQILKIVCLENNQRVRIIDNPIYFKAVTIPYGITGVVDQRSFSASNKNVVFLGALVPQKGVHLLIDIWSGVKSKFPDSKLVVIGSGSLYAKNTKLGPRQIAEESYEKRIFEKINPLESDVVFLGNLNAQEKANVLNTCSVGIVNPSGSTETFCLSAVEFQQRSIPVVSARKYGLLDTISHKKSGYLVLHRIFLARYIVKLLSDEKLNIKMGKFAQEQVLSKYNLDKVTLQWVNLFEHLEEPHKTSIMKKSKKIHLRSPQAILGLLNRQIIRFLVSRWPTQVEWWDKIKFFVRWVRNILPN